MGKSQVVAERAWFPPCFRDSCGLLIQIHFVLQTPNEAERLRARLGPTEPWRLLGVDISPVHMHPPENLTRITEYFLSADKVWKRMNDVVQVGLCERGPPERERKDYGRMGGGSMISRVRYSILHPPRS